MQFAICADPHIYRDIPIKKFSTKILCMYKVVGDPLLEMCMHNTAFYIAIYIIDNLLATYLLSNDKRIYTYNIILHYVHNNNFYFFIFC